MITPDHVVEALRHVEDPELKRSLVDLGMVRDVKVEDGGVRFTLALTTMRCPLRNKMLADAKAAIMALDGVRQVDIDLAEMSDEDKQRLAGAGPRPGMAASLNQIRHVIAVMSGKGGVGKSLVSGLLAVALRREGHRVGVLDADITGPSIPRMFFPDGARIVATPLGIFPAQTRTGIKVMSINLLVENEDEAVIWRGPVINRAIQQFWGDVLWQKLDYLMVDLPPGTSDSSLTVMQSLPLSGILLVTSPQGLAGMVVRKAAQMAQQLGVPIFGLVENMSYFLCPDTGNQHDIFGPSHAEETSIRMGVPFLGRLPIDPTIARLCDSGCIEEYPAEAFEPVARRIVELAPRAVPPGTPRP